jgi:glycyl-tRNA synthetase beta chain
VELIVEIGSEEIPARFIPPALAQWKEIFLEEMAKVRIPPGPVKTVGTPRRLALLAYDLPETQEETVEEVMGPPKKVAFDQRGNPGPAALGFARAQGVDIAQLAVVSTAKGDYICARKKHAGRPTSEVLAEVLPNLITSISFPKSMRWNASRVSFARPIRWLVAVLDGRALPIEVGGIKAGSNSLGHRFLSGRTFPVSGPVDYPSACRDNFVIVDPDERRKIIENDLKRIAEEKGGQIVPDAELMDTVVNLVEYPQVLLGHFEADFISLPREVLITVMRDAQFYFSLASAKGELLPCFSLVTDGARGIPDKIVEANQRVLRAKLADAKFFFQADSKTRLADRVDSLKGLIFQAQLGTAYEKSQRLVKLASYLADIVDPAAKEAASRAALLAKADLTTQMVVEFPKLQGAMGREYARLSGEDPQVAQAIYEHYLPKSYGQESPGTTAGVIVSLADKIDTIVGCFSVGLVPTGTADPYGLRRAALGIIQLLIDNRLSLSISALAKEAFSLVKEKAQRDGQETVKEVVQFFQQRMFGLLNRDYPYDIVDAGLSAAQFDPFLASLRVKALEEFKGQGLLYSLALSYKRVANILQGINPDQSIDPELFAEPSERNLHNIFVEAKENLQNRLEKREFLAALTDLYRLKEPIDTFFDDVLVMAEDERLRSNRLALLNDIKQIFILLADFAKLPT